MKNFRPAYSGNAAADYFIELFEQREYEAAQDEIYLEKYGQACTHCKRLTVPEQIERNDGYCDPCVERGHYGDNG